MKTFSLLTALLLAAGLFAQTPDSVSIQLRKGPVLAEDSITKGDTVAIKTNSKMPVPVTMNGRLMQPANDTTSNISVSVYSDLVGFGSNQPNGLIQTDAFWSWNLNIYRVNPYFQQIRRDERQQIRTLKVNRNDSIRRLTAAFEVAEERRRLLAMDTTKRIICHREEKMNKRKNLASVTNSDWEKNRRDSTASQLDLNIHKLKAEYKNERFKVRGERRDMISKPIPDNTFQMAIMKNVVFPVLTLSKIDNEDRFREVTYYDRITPGTDSLHPADTTHQRYIHTFDLIRYSNVSVSTKINVFYLYFNRPSIGLYFDFYAGLYSTGVRDTTLSKDNFYVYSRAIGYNIRASTKLNQKVNVEIWLTSFYLTLLNNDIYQKTGALHFPDSNPANNTINENNIDGKISLHQQNIWMLGAQLVFTPDPVKKTNKVFMRFGYYKNPYSGDGSTKKINGNNFMQFQVGYRKSIDIRNL